MTTIPPPVQHYVLDDDPRLVGALQSDQAVNVLGLRSAAFHDDTDFMYSTDTSYTDSLRRELIQMIDGLVAGVAKLKEDVAAIQESLVSQTVTIKSIVDAAQPPPDDTLLHVVPSVPVSSISIPKDGAAAMQAWIKDTAPKIESLRAILRALNLVTNA